MTLAESELALAGDVANSRTKSTILRTFELPARLPWRSAGIRVRWFDQWDAVLDEALDLLPPQDDCDHETFRLLTQPTSVPKRHALVEQHGNPVGIASLRRRRHFWEPVTDHCVPFALVPAAPGMHGRVLGALGVEVHCNELVSIEGLQPASFEAFEVYRLDLTDDFEGFWRSTGQWRAIQRARRQSQHLRVRVGDPADLGWILERWARRWRSDPHQLVNATDDRRRVWPHLARAGRMFTVTLLDGDDPVAGRLAIEYRGGLVDQILVRAEHHPVRSLGTRMDDVGYEIAAQLGYAFIDLGGYYEYKRKWAPSGGVRYAVEFQPPLRQLARAVLKRVRRVRQVVAPWVAGRRPDHLGRRAP